MWKGKRSSLFLTEVGVKRGKKESKGDTKFQMNWRVHFFYTVHTITKDLLHAAKRN